MSPDPPVPPEGIIPVRSQARARDWSLALLSQGIESTVTPSDNGWELRLRPEDLEAAHTVLLQYRRENRRWHWTQPLPWPGEPFHFGALGWGMVLILFHLWANTSAQPLAKLGNMNNRLLSEGAWWRLATAISLHADLSHLIANLVTGTIVLGLALGRWGAGPALFAAWLGGVGGNVLGWLCYPPDHRGLGASGMVLAGLGLLATSSFRDWRAIRQPWFWIARSLLGGFLLFLLIGLDPASDLLAHTGGFVSGLLLGILLGGLPDRWLHAPRTTAVLVGLLLTLVLGTWILAWTHR